ncbi:MAG: TadE/TadG family type IV pilus assembly protein [Hyphomonadaceae bacterium]
MKLMRRLRRFAASKRGVAAVEFAIIAPMMIFLLFGSVDLFDVLNANKRAQNAAASVADVIARDTEVSDSELAGIWDALDILMFPNDASTMQIRVSSVSIENATTARVVWSEGHGMSARTPNSTVALPAAMMAPGTSIIMTESVYPYTAPLGFLYTGTMNLTHDAYRRSRLVDPIPRVA